MSSIRSILEELAFKHAEDGFTYSDPHDVGVDYKLIDQALKEISELIDRAKPTKSTTAVLPYGDTKFNEAIDQYQSNLKELFK